MTDDMKLALNEQLNKAKDILEVVSNTLEVQAGKKDNKPELSDLLDIKFDVNDAIDALSCACNDLKNL